MPKLIDVHHHIVPKEYSESLAKRGISKGLGVQLPRWDAKKALEVMDKNGIAASVLSISAPGVYFKDKDPSMRLAKELSRRMNETCARLVSDYPERFGAFATLPLPDVDAAIKELDHAYEELKLDGVALLSNYDGYYLGDPKFDGLLSELNRKNAVVFIHPASPPGIEASHLGLPESMVDVCFDTTRTVFSLILNGAVQKYPNIRFILAHAGGSVPYLAARLGLMHALNQEGGLPGPTGKAGIKLSLLLPEGPDFYLKKFYYDTALSASPHAFASLLTLVDSSKIVFGSDYVFAPLGAVPLTVRGIEEYAGFSEEDREAIENKNALSLFPRLKLVGAET